MASNPKSALFRARSFSSETTRGGLQSYGVEDVDRRTWREWEDSSLVITPSKTEVLITYHGGRYQFHQGNLRFKVLLENYLKFYMEAPASARRHIVVTVIGVVKSYGGRFLIPIEGGLWHVADSSLEEETVIAEFETTTRGSANKLIAAAGAFEMASGRTAMSEIIVADTAHIITTRDIDDNDKESSFSQDSVQYSNPSTDHLCEPNMVPILRTPATMVMRSPKKSYLHICAMIS
jgi:hypothetical protein